MQHYEVSVGMLGESGEHIEMFFLTGFDEGELVAEAVEYVQENLSTECRWWIMTKDANGKIAIPVQAKVVRNV